MSHIFGRHAGRLALATLMLAGIVGVAGTEGATAAGAAAASGSPLTIVMITSLTGEGASEFSTSPAGFDARIALQNAEGGVHGHKISGVILDDQTSPTEIVTAVQDALSKGAVGIVSESPLFFLAAKYPNQAGMPVTGGFFDGPEWGTQPYTNMFAADAGSVDPEVPGQHCDRRLHEGPRWHGSLLVRVRHLALLDSVGHRHGRLLRARRRQRRRARHLDPVSAAST